MHDISPADWKTFKPLREAALERICERVLDEVAGISLDQSKTRPARNPGRSTVNDSQLR